MNTDRRIHPALNVFFSNNLIVQRIAHAMQTLELKTLLVITGQLNYH